MVNLPLYIPYKLLQTLPRYLAVTIAYDPYAFIDVSFSTVRYKAFLLSNPQTATLPLLYTINKNKLYKLI